MKPCTSAECESKKEASPYEFMRTADYVFRREGACLTLTYDNGTKLIYSPAIRSFVVAYDPKRPPLVSPPTQEELESLKL